MATYQTFRNLSKYHGYPATINGIQGELYLLKKEDNRGLSKRNRVFFLHNDPTLVGSVPGTVGYYAKPNVFRPAKRANGLLLCDHINKRTKFIVTVDETGRQVSTCPTYKHLDGDLMEDDIVEFGKLTYRVQIRYLNLSRGDNATIFNLLGIDKKKIASLCYGYPSGGGERPVSKDHDYAALSRLVDNLIDFIITHPDTWESLQ